MNISPPRLVILGAGFGAFNLIKHLKNDYQITVVSPRNHFLFTPLLPSTTVGTVEFRSIIEPIRHARADLQFFHALGESLDTDRGVLECAGALDGARFSLAFDILVIAVGAVSNTYGVPGVADHALFLRELSDARELRRRIILCFERANLPTTTVEERRRLLHFVVCGGGATGIEFAAELNDFMMDDLRQHYPQLVADARITIVEATKEILSTFDERLRQYAANLFLRKNIGILTESVVVRVDERAVSLKDGAVLPYGLLLWSTGNGPALFVQSLTLPKDVRERILVDRRFRVKGYENIYALGDCSVVEGAELPATSQVAQQQGKYVARALNRRARGKHTEPFEYRHLGMLAYIGGGRALADLQTYKGHGWSAWIFWRSAYLSRIVSVKNKVMVLFDWMKAKVFGRDISQF